MKYGQIRKYDIANGPGIRTSFFVTGCSHHCKNCFNKEYQNFDFGNDRTDEETKTIINNLNSEQVSGLTILGGEPFENAFDLVEIVKKIREKTNKSIWIYSGFLYDELILIPKCRELLELCDILVDGEFVEEEKDLSLKFRGSKNQRIIDIKKSLNFGDIVLLEGYN